MTLAQQIASGERTTRDLIDEGFNKYAFKDRDGLPEWFLDDEHRHDTEDTRSDSIEKLYGHEISGVDAQAIEQAADGQYAKANQEDRFSAP